jgi:hypothetical protein
MGEAGALQVSTSQNRADPNSNPRNHGEIWASIT